VDTRLCLQNANAGGGRVAVDRKRANYNKRMKEILLVCLRGIILVEIFKREKRGGGSEG